MKDHLAEATSVLAAGGLIAYPTEGVYGLGCDPFCETAVRRLLELKHRSVEKGLILLAADFAVLEPLLAPLSSVVKSKLLSTWPGPVTWVVPASKQTPRWISGGRDTLAVRITAHPLARELCARWGKPLVSTSANPEGKPPAHDAAAVQRYFAQGVDYILEGALGGLAGPTPIRNALDDVWLRGTDSSR